LADGGAAGAIRKRDNPDDSSLGSRTEPDLRNIVAGDGTYIPAMWTATEQDEVFDPVTGEVSTPRFDPDAQTYTSADGQEFVRGIGFVNMQVQNPAAPGERVSLAFSAIDAGGEAQTAVRLLESLTSLTWMSHYTYDMAIRGTHILRLYRCGLVPIVKVARGRDGKVWTLRLRARTFRNGTKLPLDVVDGALGLSFEWRGEDLFVPFNPVQLLERRNADGTYRFYGRYRVSNNPHNPESLRGEEFTLRLNKPEVVENLRFFNEHMAEFAPGHGQRQGTESENNRLKQTLWNGRAHSVGKARQTIDLLGFYMLTNLKAALAFQKRTGKDPFGFGGGIVGPKGHSIAA
jgi:hypothetical protein